MGKDTFRERRKKYILDLAEMLSWECYLGIGFWWSMSVGTLEPDPEGLMTSGPLDGGHRPRDTETCVGSVGWRRGFPLCPHRLRLWKWNEFNLTERGNFAWRRAGGGWKRSTLTFCRVVWERKGRERLCVCEHVSVWVCVNFVGRGRLMAYWPLWASCEILPVITLPNLDAGFEWITETFFLWPPSHWLCLTVTLSTLWETREWVREPGREVGPPTHNACHTLAQLHSCLTGL